MKVKSEKLILDFYEFIYDRQRVYHRKEVLGLEKPWTNDHRLKTYRYCNVYRENDRGTKHVIDNVVNGSLKISDKIFNIVIYRIFNTSYFFDKIQFGKPKSCKNFIEQKYSIINKFDRMKKKKIKLFNTAYMICGIPVSYEYRPEDKHVQIILAMEKFAKHIKSFKRKIKSSKDMEEIFCLLKDIMYVGPFLAYQIIVDMMYIKGFIKHDINSFVYVGPGAKRGLQILFNGLSNEKSYTKACYYLWENQEIHFKELLKKRKKVWTGIACKDSIMAREKKKWKLYIGDIQNCLCEFRKYYNHKHKPNSKKRKYLGEY